jgi:hypothetical protein
MKKNSSTHRLSRNVSSKGKKKINANLVLIRFQNIIDTPVIYPLRDNNISIHSQWFVRLLVCLFVTCVAFQNLSDIL